MKLISYIFVVLYAAQTQAQTLATGNGTRVTVEDFYAYHYMSSPQKVEALRGSPKELESTITEVLAPRNYNSDATLSGQKDPIEIRYIKLQQERAPLVAELNVQERRARARFDPSDKLILARAKEIWALNPERYQIDEQADITQIYLDPSLRSFSETVKRVEAAQTDLTAGKPFEEVLQKYSDDRNAKDNKGALKKIESSGTDALMGKIIFRTLRENEVSVPMTSRIGLHIVRLDKKYSKRQKPFDEVKGLILEQLMEESVKNARLDFLAKLGPEKNVINPKEFDDFLMKPDPKLEEKRREIYKNLGITVSEPISVK